MSIQKLHYENISGLLIRRDGLLSWRCLLCKEEGQSHEVMCICPKCGSEESPGAQAQPAPSVPDDVIEQAVNRFLSWKLPKDFKPDGGMVFIPTRGRGYNSPHWPIGTNLFTAEQAREMLRYALAATPEAKS